MVARRMLAALLVAMLQWCAPEPPRTIDIDGYPRPSSARTLHLSGVGIRDLSGIDGMDALEELNISMNPIRDLTPLRSLKKLRKLDISSTQVTDIRPLEDLMLEKLVISYSPVTDLEPLRKTGSLRELWAVGTPVADVSPLRSKEHLELLFLLQTRVQDLSPLKGLSGLRNFSVSGMQDIDYAGLPEGIRRMTIPRAHWSKITSYRARSPDLILQDAEWDPREPVSWIEYIDLKGKLTKPLPDRFVTTTCYPDGHCAENTFRAPGADQ